MDITESVFPYKVFIKLKTTDTEEIDEWCYNHFGLQGNEWDSYFVDESPFNYDMYFVFMTKEDATLFTLRWV